MTKRQLPLITKLAARAVRENDIARACDMSMNTWKRCKREQPEVEEAFAAGRQILHDSLVGKLYEKAMGGDTIALIYLTKTLLGFREGDTPQEARAQIVFQMPESHSPESYRPPVLTIPAAPITIAAPQRKAARRG